MIGVLKKSLAYVFTLALLCSFQAGAEESNDDAILINTSHGLVVKGVSEVSRGIFRGPRPTPDDIRALAQNGIIYILNLQGGDIKTPRWLGFLAYVIPRFEPGETRAVRRAEEDAAKNDNRIGYLNVPLDSLDPVDPHEAKEIDQILSVIHEAKNKPIYVHCEHGKDRTGLVIALYRIRHEGMSIEDARQEWQKMGHNGFWDWVLTGSLDKYFRAVAPRLAQQRRAEEILPKAAQNCSTLLGGTSELR